MKTLALIISLALGLHAAYAADDARLERNKKAVLDFYEKVLNKKDFYAASKHFGATYIQHNPSAADGPAGFKGFVEFLKSKFPQSRSEVKRVFAEGDYVILHVHALREPGTRGAAIVDIFRLDADGRIVEHWDVRQDVPEKAANNNTMF
jgi:predicted SnoaL-like aldol condensation-catalyzing enzyme